MLTKKKLLARIKELEYQIAGEKTARMALAHEVQATKETTQTALDTVAAQLNELAEKKANPAKYNRRPGLITINAAAKKKGISYKELKRGAELLGVPIIDINGRKFISRNDAEYKLKTNAECQAEERTRPE